MKGAARWLAAAAALALLAAALFLLAAGLTDFQPAAEEPVPVLGSACAAPGDEVSLLTWNIGYAALGAEADFFYDGGRMSRGRDEATVRRHLGAVASFLRRRPADLVLLQEVDRRARRSYGLDQLPPLRAALGGHAALFALNYRAAWVPLPILRPMGGVRSGIALFSRFPPVGAARLSLPGRFPWPTRLFMLRRCLLVARFASDAIRGGLVVVNLHLSTFDRGGAVRRREVAFLREFLLREQAAGRRLIVGGDWNHRLPGGDDRRFPATDPVPNWVADLPANWTPPGWRWAVDPSVATVRANGTPWRPGKNYRSLIDGFLVSPGIDVVEVRGCDLGFADSDHNPVWLRVRLPARGR